MQRLFMVNSALQSPTAFKTSPLVPEHVSWAIWCVTVYGYIHPGSTCPETTGQCWEHGYSETTDNVNIWPGLGEHQVLAGGYHPLSDFYYWQRNVSVQHPVLLRSRIMKLSSSQRRCVPAWWQCKECFFLNLRLCWLHSWIRWNDCCKGLNKTFICLQEDFCPRVGRVST